MGNLSIKSLRPYDRPDDWKIVVRRKKIKKLINGINSSNTRS